MVQGTRTNQLDGHLISRGGRAFSQDLKRLERKTLWAPIPPSFGILVYSNETLRVTNQSPSIITGILCSFIRTNAVLN